VSADVVARLAELGLRLPASELDDFTALVADMQAAAEVARRALPYACEPACILVLSACPAGGWGRRAARQRDHVQPCISAMRATRWRRMDFGLMHW